MSRRRAASVHRGGGLPGQAVELGRGQAGDLADGADALLRNEESGRQSDPAAVAGKLDVAGAPPVHGEPSQFQDAGQVVPGHRPECAAITPTPTP